jgi:sarcosine oxidase subunit gamma
MPRLAQVDLRVQPDSPAAQRVEAALGTALPLANASATAGRHDILWLGPDEWLVIGAAGTEAEIERRLRDALRGGFGSVVDVSANRTCLELTGSGARHLLAAVISLDLHPREFPVGRCAQTLLAKAPIILWHTDDAPTFRILVRPSFAAYTIDWLRDAIDGLEAERAASSNVVVLP